MVHVDKSNLNQMIGLFLAKPLYKACLIINLGLQQMHRCRTYRKMNSMQVNRIKEGLNDGVSLQSELITSVSPANKSQAALPR